MVGDYWYTLAMAQYRHGDWRHSLASLERMKSKESEFDAADWLLIAMNRHQLKQRVEARSALRKAVEWMEDRQRKAEDNAVLRFQYESMRKFIEALKDEAEKLIEGKGRGAEAVG